MRLYKIRDTQAFLESQRSNRPIESHELKRYDSSGSYTNKREVTCRSALKPGTYLVIPSTYEEDKEVEFLLRIFTEKPLSDAKSFHRLDSKTKVRASNVGSSMPMHTRDLAEMSPGSGGNEPPPIGFIACDFEKIDVAVASRPEPDSLEESAAENCVQM